jgi:hypothetical protein
MRRPVIRSLLPALGDWIAVPPGDGDAKALFLRHRQSWLGRSGVAVGTVRAPSPAGLTLISPRGDALCAWKPGWAGGVGEGVCLLALHSESRRRVYRLLGEAVEHAGERWPERLPFVFLDRRAAATRTKTFVRAGWSKGPDRLDGLRLWVRERSR